MKKIRFDEYMEPVENCDATFASDVGLKIHELQSKAFFLHLQVVHARNLFHFDILCI